MTTAAKPLTTKGEQTRTRIVDAAADLMRTRGVVGTTLEDVKRSAGVSSSQLYHYFADKDALTRAVVHRMSDLVVATQDQAGAGTVEALLTWRDGLVEHARRVSGVGGCPLGHLVGQLAEYDEGSRAELADGFSRWAESLRMVTRALERGGALRAGVSADDLAETLLATLQGGLLLSQVRRDPTPLATALDTLIALALRPQARRSPR